MSRLSADEATTSEVRTFPASMPRSFWLDADLDGQSRQDVTRISRRGVPAKGKGGDGHKDM